jgi:diguanylate cyclase (GGDEF)-like protein
MLIPFDLLRSLMRSRVSRLSLLLLVVTATSLVAQSRVDDGGGAGLTALERAEWSLVRPLPLVTIQIRRVVGILVLAPACTLFLLYLFRPRAYVLAWVMAWLAASAMLLVLSSNSARPDDLGDVSSYLSTSRIVVAAWAGCAVIFGISLRWGALWFRQPSAVAVAPSAKWVALAIVVWLVLSATVLGPGAVIAPAFVLMSVWQAQGAIACLRAARAYRFSGALFVGLGLMALVLSNATAAVASAASGTLTPLSTNLAYLNGLWAGVMVIGMHLLAFEDVIEELRTANAALSKGRDEMRAMAVTDPLTRCNNRRFLEEISEHELQQHRRYNLPLSLLYVDIDHFKAINDTRGHQTGDVVLRTLGYILRARTRQADYVFRWGGDEFLVLLSADETQAQAKAEEIRQAFLDSPIVRELPDGVDLSIGCVAVPPETDNFEPLIDQADREMYRRKRALAS